MASKIVGNYSVISELGVGSFSTVFKVQHDHSKEIFACKVFPKSNLADRGDEERFQREINAMAFLRHPCLVALHDLISDNQNFYLILDFCEGGELFDYLCDHDRLDEPTAAYIFKQLVEALNYCHSFGVAHRDLKPENILIAKFPQVKISDFGLCGYISNDKLMHTFCGSPCYCSPECLCRVQYDGRKSDIWSLGVILYAMVTGEHPWDISNTNAMLRQILKADFTIPDYVSMECQNLIYNLMRVEPDERFSLDEILNHPWIEIAAQPKYPKLTMPSYDDVKGPSIEELSSASAQSSQRSDHGIISPFEDNDSISISNLSPLQTSASTSSCLPRLRIRSSSLGYFEQQTNVKAPPQRKGPLRSQQKPMMGYMMNGRPKPQSFYRINFVPQVPYQEFPKIDE